MSNSRFAKSLASQRRTIRQWHVQATPLKDWAGQILASEGGPLLCSITYTLQIHTEMGLPCHSRALTSGHRRRSQWALSRLWSLPRLQRTGRSGTCWPAPLRAHRIK